MTSNQPINNAKSIKEEIFQQIQTGNLEQLKKTLTKELLNIKDRSGHTLLYNACLYNQLEIIKYLIHDMGCDLNAISSSSSSSSHLHATPLTATLIKDNYELFEYLIKNENADCKGRFQLNLLHEVASKNRLDLVELLINKGADPNQLNTHHMTPLTIAIQQNNFKMVECLLENGSCVNIQDKKGNTPLHIACTSQQLNDNLIELLIHSNNECDFKIKNINEETALDLLWSMAIKEAKLNLIDLIDKLIQQGALFSMPWNLAFSNHNHLIFIKCISKLCKYRLKDLFLNDKPLINSLIINGYWSNSLIVSIKSVILNQDIHSSQEEQQELFKSIEQIIYSGQFKLNLKDIISTFYMFDDLSNLLIYKKLCEILSQPLSLINLSRISIRNNLKIVDCNHINSLNLPDQMKKFLLFEQ